MVLHVVAGSYYSSSIMWLPLTCNDPLATVNLQWFTCDANFHPIEIILTRSMVKTIWKSDENWLRYQRIASKVFSMLKLLLHAIAHNSNVQLQLNHKLLAMSVRVLRHYVLCSFQGGATQSLGCTETNQVCFNVLIYVLCPFPIIAVKKNLDIMIGWNRMASSFSLWAFPFEVRCGVMWAPYILCH